MDTQTALDAMEALSARTGYNAALFVIAYRTALLWTSTDDENGGEPLDENYGHEDLSEDAQRRTLTDCVQFIEENLDDLRAFETEHGRGPEYAGHDFLLTRCGHGAGFWDRGAGELGERLSEASRLWGEVYAYVYEGTVEVG